MPDFINLKNQVFSFLGKDSSIKGTFHLKGVTHIASQLEGELFMDNDSDLCIESSGSFEGSVECHNIEIYGSFTGELKASGKVTVYPPARLEGKINAGKLEIHPGATLNMSGHTDEL
jgi:cytoskeletal protein CcmA (bactofilin family)